MCYVLTAVAALAALEAYLRLLEAGWLDAPPAGAGADEDKGWL